MVALDTMLLRTVFKLNRHRYVLFIKVLHACCHAMMRPHKH